MSPWRTNAVRATAGLSLLMLLAGPGAATPPWMSQEAIRSSIIGKTLDGHYGNGQTWTESYAANGRLDYREARRRAVGNWHFRGAHVFCTFYDPPYRPALSGGCWTVLKASANCYEFFLVSAGADVPEAEADSDRPLHWGAQGWRQGEPSTCTEKPSV